MTTEGTPVSRRDTSTTRESLASKRHRARQPSARKNRANRPTLFEHTTYTHNFHLRSILRAWRRFRSGALSHWTTTVIIALSLTIHGCFVLLLTNADSAIQKWQGDNLVTVFMKKETDVAQLTQTRDQLQSKTEIQGLTVITPDEAMGRMKSMLGPEASLLDDLSDNPLPYSLEFRVQDNDQNHLSTLAGEIRSWPDVEAVSYDHEWAKKLSAVISLVRYAGMALLFLLLTAVTLIISNTIKLTIIARRDEIEVTRFMGATNTFIKAPFFYEGVIQGFLGALGAIGMTLTLYIGASQIVSDLANTLGFHLEVHFLSLPQLAFTLTLGIALGLLGALISLSRFLEI